MATEKPLADQLLDATAKALLQKIKDGDATAADLAVARQLCRDAGVTLAFKGEPTTLAAASLLESLREIDEDDLPTYN
jgi:hypothetical protein